MNSKNCKRQSRGEKEESTWNNRKQDLAERVGFEKRK